MNQYKRHVYECESTMEWVEAADLTSRCSNHSMHTLHDDDDGDDDHNDNDDDHHNDDNDVATTTIIHCTWFCEPALLHCAPISSENQKVVRVTWIFIIPAVHTHEDDDNGNDNDDDGDDDEDNDDDGDCDGDKNFFVVQSGPAICILFHSLQTWITPPLPPSAPPLLSSW